MIRLLPALCLGIIMFISILNLFLSYYSSRKLHAWLTFIGAILLCILTISNRSMFSLLESIDRVWFDLVIPFLFLGICYCMLMIFNDFFFRYSWRHQLKTLSHQPGILITFIGAVFSTMIFIFEAQSGKGNPIFNISATLTYVVLNIQMIGYLRQEIAGKPVTHKLRPPKSQWPFPQNGGHHILKQLSKREMEVLELIARGLTDKEIGEQLYISVVTIKSHARNIYKKLNVKNRTQAGLIYKQLHNHHDFKSN